MSGLSGQPKFAFGGTNPENTEQRFAGRNTQRLTMQTPQIVRATARLFDQNVAEHAGVKPHGC
jgi:hypothetical protein